MVRALTPEKIPVVAAKRLVPYVRVLVVMIAGLVLSVTTHHPQHHPQPVHAAVAYGPYVPVERDEIVLAKASRDYIRPPLHKVKTHRRVVHHEAAKPAIVPPAQP